MDGGHMVTTATCKINWHEAKVSKIVIDKNKSILYIYLVSLKII